MAILQDASLTFALADSDHLSEFKEKLRLFERQITLLFGSQALQDNLEHFTQAPHHGLLVDALLLNEINLLEQLQDVGKKGPLVVISEDTSAQMRFQSAIAGATMFAPAPFDLFSIIEHVEMRHNQQNRPPHRVFFLEDDTAMQEVHRIYLKNTQIEAHFFENPTQLFKALETQRPDMFVLDVEIHGSRFNGLDVARAIRLDSRYLSVPIMLLSGHVGNELFFKALESGCDLVLHKPINLDHLHAAMLSRLERFGILSDQIMHDGLTRLYNHTHFKGHLLSLLAQAKRNHSDLSLAMIDIDHFKQINDTFGHQTGDRIIVGLAKLLRRRLRRSDIIGRYGGDEFGVLLPSTTAEMAFGVLNEIRQDFSELLFEEVDPDFEITFSCGIAEVNAHCTSELALTRASDIALYRAKHRGKNRVVIAED